MTLAALAGLAGCAKENADSLEKNPTGNTIVTLTANQENAETKAEISSENIKTINWTTDDAITVIDGAGNNVEFTLTEGEGTSSGKFKGEVSQTADSYIALYPYQKDVTASEGTLKGVVLKSEQTAVAGSFDPEAALMMAESEAGSLSFKNIVGFVKVTPTVSCARITLVSNNSESKLAGTADITMTDGKPTATVTDGASSSVSIVGDIKAGSIYYLAIFPETLAGGFRLVFTTADGQDTYKSTTNELAIKRNYVTNLGNVEGKADEYPYVTFTAASEQTFRMKLVSVIKDKLEYSVGGANWQSLASNADITFGGSNGSLRLRGKSDVGTAYYTNTLNSSKISFGNTEVNVSCTGDIRTLVDWEYYGTANTENARFSHLFKNCAVLTSAPKLPMKKLLSQYCCEGMFEGCSKLSIAPELPATELAYMCYYRMFFGCNGLTQAPDLPAQNVPDEAYTLMFNGCTSLTEMPTISATSVGDSGMNGMFYSCSKLKTAKDLTVSSFSGKKNCNQMFEGCIQLENAPALPAMKVTESCYQDMFKNCQNLRIAPNLPATTVDVDCYTCMFQSCTNLEQGPMELPAETLRDRCYTSMFYGCSSLTKAPKLSAKTMAHKCYEYMFAYCKNIKEADISAENVAIFCFHEMFNGCSNLKEVTIYVNDFDKNQYGYAPNEYMPDLVFYPFEGWLNGTAETGTVHIRSGLTETTKEAIYLPNSNWTFVEDVTD